MPKRPAKPKKPASPPAKSQPQRVTASSESSKHLTIVGVGASAGGLAAVIQLIEPLRLKNMALIVVQHLAPDHESMLAEILGRKCTAPVVTAADGHLVEAGVIYVIPPNTDLRIESGSLNLSKRSDRRGTHMPVDLFFKSLAEDQGTNAVGVVLSGTGSDGTQGLEAIKAAGGVTFAQLPESAAYGGMPQSAHNGGNADLTLAPRDIAKELEQLNQRLAHRTSEIAEPESERSQYLDQLFALVRRRFGTNLALYKIATVERRLARRLALCKISDLHRYVQFVRGNHDEQEALHREMLISVTRFFRVPVAFSALQEKIRERWPTHAEPHHPPLRVWVPGCATGEEAYSIAILILEEAERAGHDWAAQIFATDVDDQAIAIARRGTYGQHIATEMSQERLDRHFSASGDGYMVSGRLRDMIVFSHQDILRDPPFPRIDLVSFRNLLIYFKPEAQQQCLRSVHYAMKDDGWLMLGTSEGLGDMADMFSLADPKNKIYGKRLSRGSSRHGSGRQPTATKTIQNSPSMHNTQDLPELADEVLLQTYVYPGAIVDSDYRILHFRGDTGPFLGPLPGTASLNIIKLVRSDLQIELSQALKQARSREKRVTMHVTSNEKQSLRKVAIDVVPFRDEQKSQFFLVVFHQTIKSIAPTDGSHALHRSRGVQVKQLMSQVEELENKLSASHEYLQSVIEEKESANEELKASAEEMQASNEELQSANEELETSREEMQSANEELTTVNEELQNRLTQLAEVNDDLHNVMAGVDNPVFIVSLDLTIRRFTHAAKTLFGYSEKDAGRSVRVLESFTGDCDLVSCISRVIQTLAIIEKEILGANKRWYLLRIVPYKTLGHRIRGAVVSLIDRDVEKRVKQTDKDVALYVQQYLAEITHPWVILDKTLRSMFANQAFYSAFQVAPEELIGATFAGHISGDLSDGVLHGWLLGTMRDGQPFYDRNLQCLLPDVGMVDAGISGKCIQVSDSVTMILLSIKIELGLMKTEGRSDEDP